MKTVKYLVLSDIHLGHNVNPTMRITENIKYFFKYHEAIINDIDILFIAGDVFDRYLPSHSMEYLETHTALAFIINWCMVKNVKLRILEGTPSHDWGQAKLVSKLLNEVGDIKNKIDYDYISTLKIEEMKDLNLTILYVPDEYKHKAEDTFKEIQDLMKKLSLEKVDIAIMHGHFEYQLPMVKLPSSHDSELMQSIVKHYINIGHIHTHSVNGRILAQGSFDRLAHGEEEEKGGMVVKIRDNGNDEYMFLPNKKAMIFRTYDFRNLDISVIVRNIKNILSTLPKQSAVRLLVDDKEKIINSCKEFKNLTSAYHVKIVVPDVKTLTKADKIVMNKTIKAFSITETNIKDLLESELKTLESDDNVIIRALNVFNSLIK